MSHNGTTMDPLPSRPIEPHLPARCPNSTCNTHLEFPIPSPPPPPRFPLKIRCFACKTIFTSPFNPTQPEPPPRPRSSSSSSSPSTPLDGYSTKPPSSSSTPARKSRMIGTQEKPLETEYYDLLGLTPTSTQDDIKRAYRRLAIKHHPDKNLHDPTASERFKKISIAYQTLSDPELRRRYNELGAKAGTPEGGYVDPEQVFSALFGGDKFVPIIGSISLAKEMKAAMQEAGGEDDDNEEDASAVAAGGGAKLDVSKQAGEKNSKRDSKVLSPEERAARDEKARKKSAERAAVREERVSKLFENLERKVAIFTEIAAGPNDRDMLNGYKQMCELEADDLVHESYGYELLQTIGFVYASKAKHFLATHQTFFGVGGWIHNVQSKYHVFSETVSTLRSAIELKAVFDQLQAAEKAGGLSPEERKKLEEQAAEKGVQALFKGTKLEVESVLREVCDRLLDAGAGRDKVLLRAIALQILGEAYMAVKKDPDAPGLGTGLGGMAQSGQGRAQGSATSSARGNGMGDDSEYVKVETKASRERSGRR
ncbi:DnaJ-domain-containing protein [Amanita rubescens]|nr:DnaJ-domain-containing protein [Amanita rubescens]